MGAKLTHFQLFPRRKILKPFEVTAFDIFSVNSHYEVIFCPQGKHIGRLGHQDPGEFPEEVKALFEKAVQYYEQVKIKFRLIFNTEKQCTRIFFWSLSYEEWKSEIRNRLDFTFRTLKYHLVSKTSRFQTLVTSLDCLLLTKLLFYVKQSRLLQSWMLSVQNSNPWPPRFQISLDWEHPDFGHLP